MLARLHKEIPGREKAMKHTSRKERRHFPRVNRKLPVNIIANGYDFITTTQNVSCVGAYCHVEKYIPPFTKIAVKINLPIATGEGNKHHLVECKGVVVRTEDETNGGFNIAIFFNGIEDRYRKKISQYVKQFLPHESLPRLQRL